MPRSGGVGSDGLPMIAPVAIGQTRRDGIELISSPGLLPAGARRAGLTAHWFSRGVTGQRRIVHTGCLEDGIYAPHTRASYFMSPLRVFYRVALGGRHGSAIAAVYEPGSRDSLQRSAAEPPPRPGLSRCSPRRRRSRRRAVPSGFGCGQTALPRRDRFLRRRARAALHPSRFAGAISRRGSPKPTLWLCGSRA